MAGASAMAASLLKFQLRIFYESVICSLALAGRLFMGQKKVSETASWREGSDHAMYEGVVFHKRQYPLIHQFEYKVRYALVNLDKLPSWFSDSSKHHMTAEEARAIVNTSGPVYLLCMPTSCTYEQNPLSIYYCYDDDKLHTSSEPKAIAEVTNTPWGERVVFSFNPKGDGVPKPLHVSPFMDMKGVWEMHAPTPGDRLSLTIGVDHPEFGKYFMATVQARRVDPGPSPERFLWLLPQKAAMWIYWQALILLWKGVSFVPHPKYKDGNAYRQLAQDADLRNSKRSLKVAGKETAGACLQPNCPRFYQWREAAGDPWL